MFFFKNNFNNFFFIKNKQQFKFYNMKYINYYIVGFFESFFKKKFFLKTLSNNFIKYTSTPQFEMIVEEFKFYQIRVLKGLKITEIFEII
jgi:hypothetical protein